MPESDTPDLAAGIAQDHLAPGQMIEGSYEGEPVLLARIGDRFHAIGARCSHYGGPLCEGVLAGTTVLCPWHHARFDLATGRVTAPPALSDLPTYRVAVRDGRVRIDGRDAPPIASPRAAPTPTSVVIVGAGAAGAIAAETLREAGFTGRIALLDGEPSGPVDRPNLSKDYLAGAAPEEWLPLRPAEFYRERGIELRVGTPVERIEPSAKSLTLAGGETLHWDALLLATGATPVRLSVPGADLAHVFTLRSLRDARAIIAAAARARRALVVGASFIGLEVAASLRARGLSVDVVALDAIPMERVLGPELGVFVQSLHERNGVRFHLGATLEAIERDSALLSDGTRVEAELAVLGVGVRPQTQLAERAGLACDGGVLVDALLRTSAPGVWAAGDVARWPDRSSGEPVRIEHWVLAERLGQTAARNILGAAQPFRAVPFFWSRHYDVSIDYVGSGARHDATETIGCAAHGRATTLFLRDGRIVAVASVGDSQRSLLAELAFEDDDPARLETLVDDWRGERNHR